MTRHEKSAHFSRRNLLKAGGALVVFIGAPHAFETARAANETTAIGTKPPLTPDQLSSYLAVNADGTVSTYFGKMDMGQGLSVAIQQIVAEELDVPVKDVGISIGDTATSVNQGGASGSTGVQEGGRQMRMAAAEARRVLVEMAASKLGCPRRAIDGDRRHRSRQRRCQKANQLRQTHRRPVFQRSSRLERQIRQPALRAGQSAAEGSEGSHHRRAARSARRHRAESICPDGFRHRRQSSWHDARPHDPAGIAGAVPVSVDESSIKHIPSAKVVRDKGFLGVVAEKEWDAIKAAKELKVAGRTRRRRSSTRRHCSITSARRRRASTKWKASSQATSMRRSNRRPASSKPNISGRSSRMPAWGRLVRWSISRMVMPPAGVARRKHILCRRELPPFCKCRGTMFA